MQPCQDSPLSWTLPLSSEPCPAALDLSAVGGKGANLARLAQAGLAVPPGFLITTAAYRAFVAANDLGALIQAVLAGLPAQPDMQTLEQASAQLRQAFQDGRMPEALARDFLGACDRLGAPAAAVRSSATAEDLPEMSFAGQQDTYLNVTGAPAVLSAIQACWGSLWTARAVGYRLRNQVNQNDIALAVIVQHMVPSEASGVLFTANPLSGLRGQMVIDAALGLGEALVSGQVEPDHYVVDTLCRRIVEKTLGAKALSIRSAPGGGVITVDEQAADLQALDDAHILELARLGEQVSALYGAPQDIEWALAGGELFLLQSRPITSLYPLPEGMPAEPLQVMFSFGAVQGMLDPITPAGQYAMKHIFASVGSLFGLKLTPASQRAGFLAGERLWMNISPVLRNKIGRRAAGVAFASLDPGAQAALSEVLQDPRLQPGPHTISRGAAIKIVRFFLPTLGNVLLNLAFPDRRRPWIVNQGEAMLAELQARIDAVQGDAWQRLSQQAGLLPRMFTDRLPHVFRRFLSGVIAGQAAYNLLRLMVEKLPPAPGQPDWNDLLLEATRGMPHNPTTEMDLALWQVAQAILQDPQALHRALTDGPQALAEDYAAARLPQSVQSAMSGFLAKYGGRGLAEIDLGRPRWNENPAEVFAALSGYLQIDDPALAPDQVFARGAVRAEQAGQALVAALRRQPGGFFKAARARFLFGRARALLGMRESPKFFAVCYLAMTRWALLETANELVKMGQLDQASDLFLLDLEEMRRFAAREERDWRSLIARRRETYRREQQRRQVPRLLLSDGRAYFEGLSAARPTGAGEGAILGSPVSPGAARGPVRVVIDPRQANLQPGEILVCRGTDPSWTPLFLTAAGLVMEVGGMMTHGAVVAREYGIPAVVGVDQATARLQTGQWIEINGSSGEVTRLENVVQD